MILLFIYILVSLPSLAKKPPLHLVDLNSASAGELEQVPGIGPTTAEEILQMRKSHGAFKNVDDLLAIKGIGKKRLDKVRKYLTMSKPPARKPATASDAGTASKAPPQQRPAAKLAPNAKTPTLQLRSAKTKSPKGSPRGLKPGGLRAMYGTTGNRALPKES
jgi:competence ComEA-like helix-hairpin-helix protein